MKIACAFILSSALAGISLSQAQEIHEAKKERIILDRYVAALTTRGTGYFYGLYVDNYLSVLDASDSIIIKKYLSAPNDWSDQRSILISGIPDLDRLNKVHDTILVYGPRSMRPIVRDYVPSPQQLRVVHKRRSLLSWFNPYWGNFGFSPYRVAYGRWFMPYTLQSVESKPNSLPFYMTQTNTNQYLLSSDQYSIHP
jgi:hypothetical protein